MTLPSSPKPVKPSHCETAEPGDIIGFVNAQTLRVGDTVYVGDAIEYPPVPSFAPEHCVTASAGDIGRYKQFRRGIEQLDQEGVVQVLRSDLRGDQNPVLVIISSGPTATASIVGQP